MLKPVEITDQNMCAFGHICTNSNKHRSKRPDICGVSKMIADMWPPACLYLCYPKVVKISTMLR